MKINRYDSRVKAMEVDERPTEQYSDIGGLDTQIQEVIALMMTCQPWTIIKHIDNQLINLIDNQLITTLITS